MDRLTTEKRSENMRRIRSTGMKPELLVRRLVHGLGYRYRLHAKDLPGKPDLAFRKRKMVIFVHGCFWHAHGAPTCPDRRSVKSNAGYWSPKLQRNKERDAEHEKALRSNGWKVLILWECELNESDALARRLKNFLGPV